MVQNLQITKPFVIRQSPELSAVSSVAVSVSVSSMKSVLIEIRHDIAGNEVNIVVAFHFDVILRKQIALISGINHNLCSIGKDCRDRPERLLQSVLGKILRRFHNSFRRRDVGDFIQQRVNRRFLNGFIRQAVLRPDVV